MWAARMANVMVGQTESQSVAGMEPHLVLCWESQKPMEISKECEMGKELLRKEHEMDTQTERGLLMEKGLVPCLAEQ